MQTVTVLLNFINDLFPCGVVIKIYKAIQLLYHIQISFIQFRMAGRRLFFVYDRKKNLDVNEHGGKDKIKIVKSNKPLHR